MEENEVLDDNQIRFKYEFRPYQKRALQELHKYINDDKIHIVAAPGAGKTILGLKLAFDFNKNTLILVPTIAIREQWIERMLNDFTNVNPDDISIDLKDMKKYNVVSYQALYEFTKEEVKAMLRKADIHTIVLDEAHHLRNAWWKLISDTVKEIYAMKVISLTATPPYDDDKNFDKYIDLCGEIDAQISIPELVARQNLCPHQDFIYLNAPDEKDSEEIDSYRAEALRIIEDFNKNDLFLKAIATHRYIICFNDYITDIVNNYDIFSIFVKILSNNNAIDKKKLLKLIGIKSGPLKISEYETLFKYLISGKDPDFKIVDEEITKLKKDLTQIGAIQEGKV